MWSFVSGASSTRLAQAVLLSWLPPVLLATFGLVVFVLPQLSESDVATSLLQVHNSAGINQWLYWGIVGVVVSVLLFLCSRLLFRTLEGYTWPDWLSRWRIERAHRPQAEWLAARLRFERGQSGLQKAEGAAVRAQTAMAAAAEVEAAAKADATGNPIAAAKAAGVAREAVHAADKASRTATEKADELELRQQALDAADEHRKRRGHDGGRRRRRARPLGTFGKPDGASSGTWLNPYPTAEKVLPTKVGNAFRSMETYGSSNLNLDVMIMWDELLTVVPKPLRDANGDAERLADLVLAIYCSAVAFTVVSCLATLDVWVREDQRWDKSLLLCFALGAVAVWQSYRGLIGVVENWGRVVRAIVVMGREPLRQHLRLIIPATTADELAMWQAVTGFTHYGAAYGPILDPFRDTEPPPGLPPAE